MQRGLPTILFDIDGTLVHFRGLGRRAMATAMETTWGIPDALEGISFVGGTDSGVARRVAPERDPGPMWRSYLGVLRGLVEGCDDLAPLPGVIALLDALRARGARLGILTGNLRGGAEIKLRAIGLLDRFDLAISAFAEDGEQRAQIAEAAHRRCGGGALTIVGDAVGDIDCARHIGARVLCVATGPQPVEMLAAREPDLLVEDLSGTDALVSWLLERP